MIADEGIKVADVKQLRDDLMIGTIIKIPTGRARLLKKYPFWAHTEKGDWVWIEIYLAEHGLRCHDREKLVKEENANDT